MQLNHYVIQNKRKSEFCPDCVVVHSSMAFQMCIFTVSPISGNRLSVIAVFYVSWLCKRRAFFDPKLQIVLRLAPFFLTALQIFLQRHNFLPKCILQQQLANLRKKYIPSTYLTPLCIVSFAKKREVSFFVSLKLDFHIFWTWSWTWNGRILSRRL